ncbi:MAG: YbaB/EbfC family nucleoid-associated protein [Sulfurovaceae bacterium]|nr:YbaB/EbfC family nucleoid-associated protein [Sulfurovaceae bacterium]
MFKGFDISKMSQMMASMQEDMKRLQEDAKNKEFTVRVGGGMVNVTINGNAEVLDISIDDSLLGDKESLQILLISAMNDAYKMVEDDKKAQAAQMMGGINPFGS